MQSELDFELPTNVRLGHIAERVVSQAIKISENYQLLFENVQILEGKNTIGEIDFILQKVETEQVIHLELAYKFYLLDPSISTESIRNWIGPNRNDSLVEKLEKLKQKQFPLLHSTAAKDAFEGINLSSVSQQLCLLASLYVPYECKENLAEEYQKAVVGYYVDFEMFSMLHSNEKQYHLPPKKQWGMNPTQNEEWSTYENTKELVAHNLREGRAVLCWQKEGEAYSQFFVVWW